MVMIWYTLICYFRVMMGLWLFSDSSTFIHPEYRFIEIFYLISICRFHAIMMFRILFGNSSIGVLFRFHYIGMECTLFWYLLLLRSLLFLCTDCVFAKLIQMLYSRINALLLMSIQFEIRSSPFFSFLSLHWLIF